MLGIPTSGQVFTLANGTISWASQRPKTVALLVGESEYMELAATGRQCAWLMSFSTEIGFPFTQATTICVDNQAAIFLAINPAVERRRKHIDIRHHYICKQVETKVIDLYHITGEENPVKSELRYPIIQAIRSQWESQDLPTFGQSVPCDR